MPSRRGYLIALLLIVGGIGFGVWRFWSIYRTVAEMPRLDMPGERTVTLAAGTWIAFAEPPRDTAEVTPGDAGTTRARCHGQDATGAQIDFETPSGDTSYQFGAYRGRSMFKLTVHHGGPATIECSGVRMTVAIGEGIGLAILSVLVGVLVGGFGGLVIAGLTFGRRRRARLQMHGGTLRIPK